MTDEYKHSPETQLALLEKDIASIVGSIEEIKRLLEKMEKHYVTHAQFAPVKNLVFGTAKVILIGFVIGLVGLVWNATR